MSNRRTPPPKSHNPFAPVVADSDESTFSDAEIDLETKPITTKLNGIWITSASFTQT